MPWSQNTLTFTPILILIINTSSFLFLNFFIILLTLLFLNTVAIGYEADVEHEQHDGMEQGDCFDYGDKERRSGLNFSYRVPSEVLQRIWATIPLENCIQIFSKTLSEEVDRNRLD